MLANIIVMRLEGRELVVLITGYTEVMVILAIFQIFSFRMEQLKQIGEVLGRLKVLMVFQDNIQINPR
ncbi:hypothetical protein Peur_048163 [Populus x canadensis]